MTAVALEPAGGPPVENPFAGQGSVLLDIGGDVGALVVVMPQALLATEVEIRVAGDDGASHHRHDETGHTHGHDTESGHAHHPHVAVVARPTPDGGRVPSLVFADLGQGTYELYVKGTDDVRLVVEVRGGEVTEAAWPE